MTHPFWVLLSVAAMVALVYVIGRVFGRARMQKRLHCPVQHQDYTVDFACQLDPEWGVGKRVDVLQCSAFGERPVSCAKGCVDVPLELMREKAHAHAHA
ncbi:hypothetical protein L6R52_38485 [Myxococcota bacterium]|nr:hypothetical protein [Myxococcota bacterium]